MGRPRHRHVTDGQEDKIQLGVPGWKDRYYSVKFSELTTEERADVSAKYAEGLCWVMAYYYNGCAPRNRRATAAYPPRSHPVATS